MAILASTIYSSTACTNVRDLWKDCTASVDTTVEISPGIYGTQPNETFIFERLCYSDYQKNVHECPTAIDPLTIYPIWTTISPDINHPGGLAQNYTMTEWIDHIVAKNYCANVANELSGDEDLMPIHRKLLATEIKRKSWPMHPFQGTYDYDWVYEIGLEHPADLLNWRSSASSRHFKSTSFLSTYLNAYENGKLARLRRWGKECSLIFLMGFTDGLIHCG